MTILHGDNGKTIQFSVSDVIRAYENDVYVPELPMIVCDDKKVAERMQKDVATFISGLSKELLKD